jgi:anti-anti-sigma factor
MKFVPASAHRRVRLARVISGRTGQWSAVDERMVPSAQGETGHGQAGSGTTEVTTSLAGDVATLTVTGELTEEARRPLVRTMTDLLLAEPGLHRVRLDTRAVTYVNSAGMAVLVQLQKLGQPRGVETVLVDPPSAVARPLQLSGLWLRFPVEE